LRVIRIELHSWEAARGRAAPIRFAVFVEEQGVPAEIEMDQADASCIHALALHAEQAIATARLLPDGHIGRMAVLKPWRGRGVGTAMLEKLIALAAERGQREIRLSAQLHAVGFYRAHGFQTEGGVYQEAGIPHQAMLRRL
jgi:predicted GNAT family N-acyltransferase